LLVATADRVAVKWIDFGLAKVVIPLHTQIRRTQQQTTQFGVRVAGTWDYAPPEQRGNTNFGKPSAKSDVFSFGKTMLRLCSGKEPQNCRERDLPEQLKDLLFDCIEEKPEERPDFSTILEKLQLFQAETEREHREKLAQIQQSKQRQEREVLKFEQQLESERKQREKVPQQNELGELFEFDVITVDETGEEIKRVRGKNYQKVYDLGNGVKVELVYIPAGEFMMGSPDGEGDSDEHPRHKVVIAKPFYMGKYPVTQEQWEAVMGNNPSYFKGKKFPVEQVSWNDAKEFCKKLSERLGEKLDLPSEAMWEYTCRAGTTTKYSFGDIITSELANYWASEIKQTTEVGKYPANAFGLYDMHGNVWEWCEDVWHENYNGAPTDGSAWVKGGNSNKHLLRGGSWDNDDDYLLCASRNGVGTTFRNYFWGFRFSKM